MPEGRNGGTLTNWKPGQSGNPAGSSKKLRGRKLLRELLNEELDRQIDADLLAKILGKEFKTDDEAYRALVQLGEDVSQGRIAIRRVVRSAMGAHGDKAAAIAMGQIFSLEPKTLTIEQGEPPESPNKLPSEADQKALEAAGQDSELLH